MANKWRVKLYDNEDIPWDLVMICHVYPDVHRWIKSKTLRATHFTSLDDAKQTVETFIKNDGDYNVKIVEI
jgi:hypothetical protein